MSKVKLPRLIILGLVCMLFLVSSVFVFAATIQLELQMTPFPAPTNLTAIVISNSQIDLNWSPVSIAVSYKVYRDGISIASSNVTSYSDTGLTLGKTYSYTVSGVSADGAESLQSFPVLVTISSGSGMSSAWFMLPKALEGGFRILINQGAEYTDSLIVTLTLFGGPDTARMAISNFSDFRDAGQEKYQTTKEWNLCKGLISCPEGEYIVYAKFFTSWGTASEVASDSIIYRKKPTIEKIKQKLVEITKKIVNLKNQIARLFLPPKKIVPEEIPPEEMPPPLEEPPVEEIVPPLEEVLPPEKIIPPSEELPKPGPIEVIKEFGKWLWQKITNFWQKIWPF